MMRKYLLILSLLISAAGMAQAPNYLYGKDVIVTTRDTSSAEFTIRNTTRNVLGYFKNIGGGKGQYTLIPQTDIIALPDSLLARYTKTQSDARYKSISYVPDWLDITGKPANFSTTYALSNDIQDSLLNKVSRSGSYADPSWITSLNYSKLTGTIPTWNQNTTGNAATSTLAANSTQWNTLNISLSTYISGTVPSTLIYNSTNSRVEFGTWDQIKTFLGLGSYAYRSSGLAELSGATYSGHIAMGGYNISRVGTLLVYANSSYPDVDAVRGSNFGYSLSYPTLVIGSNSANTTLAFNVDVIANPSAAFSGAGNEYIWRNTGGFITPNAANTAFNTLFTWNSSGNITSPNSITANTLIKSGGTSSQFLKADGSVDNNTYITGINSTLVTTALGFTPENSANKGIANGYVDLDAGGKIPASRIDFGQTGQTFVVASQAAMLAVSGANIGALAVRTDESKNYRLIGQPASTLANWQLLLSPDAPVQSVNGFTGNVNLLTTHISEGSNYWWTAARSRAAQSLTTSGSSGAATYDNTTGVLNIPTYTLSGLGGQPALSGTGFVKISGATISYDNSTYLTTETDPTIYSWAKAASKPSYSWGEITGTVPTWNQNTTGNAATATNVAATGVTGGAALSLTDDVNVKISQTGSSNALLAAKGLVMSWSGQLSVARGGTGQSTLDGVRTWLELGSYAYRSSGLAELTGATFTGAISGTTGSFSTSISTNYLSISSINTELASINSTNTNGGYITWRINNVVIADIGTARSIFGAGGTETFGINARGERDFVLGSNNTERFRLASSGAATFTSTVTASSFIGGGSGLTSLPSNTALYPNLNQNTTGNAATASNSTQWNGWANLFPSGIYNETDYDAIIVSKGGLLKREYVTTLSGALGLGSNAYSSTDYLPLGGGILTGPLTGTSAIFNGTVLASSGLLVNSSVSSPQVFAARGTYFGYSTNYPIVMFGTPVIASGSTSLAFNVDPVANTSGSFTGNGSEYMWRNSGSFITPNSANNSYNTLFSWNSSGQVSYGSNLTASGFVKSGSSDSYFLLGGGGHVATSNYATTSDLSLYVNMTGNQYEIAGEKTFLSNIATNGKMTAARILGSTASYTTTATISSTITTAFCSGSSYTLTLPSASGVTGQILTVISNSSLTGITLSGVEGGSYTLICNSSLVLVSNGTTWKIASSYQNSGACS